MEFDWKIQSHKRVESARMYVHTVFFLYGKSNDMCRNWNENLKNLKKIDSEKMHNYLLLINKRRHGLLYSNMNWLTIFGLTQALIMVGVVNWPIDETKCFYGCIRKRAFDRENWINIIDDEWKKKKQKKS